MSLEAFRTGLYQEHFEEVAGMYECRLENLDDLESTLEDLADLERRMEAHLDALQIGDELALEVVTTGATPDEPTSLYALVALAARIDRYDLIEGLFETLEGYGSEDGTEPEDAAAARKAVADGLAHHVPRHWEARLVAALAEATPQVIPVLAFCIGYRRWGAAAVLGAAAGRECADLAPVMAALARTRGDVRLLYSQIQGEKTDTALTASLGTLRLGEHAGITALQHVSRSHTWPAIPMSLCSGQALAGHLVKMAESGHADGDSMLALGLLGEPRGIDVLLAGLEQEEHAESAAWALFLITGAGIEEPQPPIVQGTERPDVVEQPITDEEYAAAQANPNPDPEPEQGEEQPADDEDDSPAGPQIIVDPEIWKAWIRDHRASLRVGLRHRLGAVASPLTDLDAVTHPRVPLVLRRLLADEFVIRYGIESGFEADKLVHEQRKAISGARSRVQADAVRFKPGAWYFQGQPIN